MYREPQPYEIDATATVQVDSRFESDAPLYRDPVVMAAMRYIRENVEQPTQVADVLRKVKVSRSTLEHRFVQFLGETPYAVIRRVRMDRAKQLLEHTDLSISEIAARCGYTHVPVFSRGFRARFGLSASQYRSLRRGQVAENRREAASGPDVRNSAASDPAAHNYRV
jgi:LacI family transcriptional regulator